MLEKHNQDGNDTIDRAELEAALKDVSHLQNLFIIFIEHKMGIVSPHTKSLVKTLTL